MHLLQRLIDRHRADRHRRIADDPLARQVDVAPGGEVHDRVGAPADRPHHLLYLLLDRRGHGGVADIGVDLGEEVPADDHRLGFGVIDVGWDDGAAARDLVPHKLRRHEERQRRAEALPVGEPRLSLLGLLHATEIFAMRDIDHLLGDDAGAGEFELGHRAFAIGIGGAPRGDPLCAQARLPALDVDGGVRVGIGTGRVVHAERRARSVRSISRKGTATSLWPAGDA